MLFQNFISRRNAQRNPSYKPARVDPRLRRASASVIEQLEQRQLLSATDGVVSLSPPIIIAAGPGPTQVTTHTTPVGGNTTAQLTITPTYDSTVTSDPRSAQIQSAFAYAISEFETNFSTPAATNVTITVVGSPGTSILGQSSGVFLNSFPYSTVRSALISNNPADAADLPAADPISTAHAYWVPTAEQKALGLASPSGTDGTFTFGLGFNYSFDPANRAVAGDYDFIGVAEHEISEVMGRIPGLGESIGGTNAYFPHDMFRFSAANTRGFNTGAGNYFSLDNGTTNLKTYNDHDTFGGDSDDWASGTNDTFNAFSGSGAANVLSAVDKQLMPALGYSTATVQNTTLAISDSVIGTPTVAGNNVTYSVSVTNTGAFAATGVTFSEVVPAGTTFVSATQNSGPSFALTGTGPITGGTATLASGASATFTFVDAVPASTASGTPLTDGVSISASNAPTATGSATATVTTSADLQLSVTESPSPVVAGTDATYTVSVYNAGPSDAQNVSLLASGIIGESFVSQSGLIASPLAAGATSSYTVVYQTFASDPNGSSVSVTRTVSSTTSDPAPSNNTTTTTTPVITQADLSVLDTGTTSAIEGTDSTYTVTVTNNGPSDAQNVVLTNVLPGGAEFDGQTIVIPGSSQPANPGRIAGGFVLQSAPANGANGNVVYTDSTLAAGQSTTFLIYVVPDEGSNTFTSSVSSDTTDLTPSNNQSSVINTVSDVPLTSTSASLPFFTEGAATGTVTLGTFTDSYASSYGDLEGAADFTAQITWAPGNVTAGTITQSAANKNVYTVTGSTTFAEEGLFAPSIVITDDGAQTTTIADQAVVFDAPLTGTATIITPVEGDTTKPPLIVATFTDAAGSYADIGDYIANINWGDGHASAGVIQADPNVTGQYDVIGYHEYHEEGTYSIGVSIHDAATSVGVTSTANVSDPAVVASPVTGPFSAVEGSSTGSLVVATFTDPAGAEPNIYDPGVIASHYTANINWGDGTPNDTTGAITYNAATQIFTVTASHTYAEESTNDHTGTGTVYDINVNISHEMAPVSNTVSVAIAVSDPAVVATGGFDFTPVEGADTGPLVLATFTDPGGPEVTDDYTATVNWGDGTTPDTNATISYDAGTQTFSVTDNHTYAEESAPEHTGSQPYDLTVTVAHESAPVSNTVHDTATVSDPAVVATGGSPIEVNEGQSTGPVVLATFTDPGGPETTGDYSASIDWGDGTPVDNTGAISFDGVSTFTVTGTHTYAEESSAEHPNSQPYEATITVHHESAPDAAPVQTSVQVDDPAVVATAGKPIKAVEGQTTGKVAVATFTDPGGAEATSDYSAGIDWGDGSGIDYSGSITYKASTQTFSVIGQHTYAEESAADHPNSTPYQVTVVISHESAPDSSPVTTTATIAEVPVVGYPLPNVATPVQGVSTGPIALAKFIDPGDAEINPVFDYSTTVNFHDGTPAVVGALTYNGVTGYFTVTASHTYNSAGTFAPPTITITHETTQTVVNDLNKVTVAPAKITASPVITTALEGRSVGTVATFTDTNPALGAGNFTASVVWGDGNVTAGTITLTSPGHFKVSGTHAYLEELSTPYSVKVTITPSAGVAATVTSKVTVLAAPLDTPVGKTITIPLASTLTNAVLGSFRDQDSLNTSAGDYKGTITWGDGKTSSAGFVQTGAVFNVGSYWNVLGGHKYAAKGNYTVKITLYDTGTPSMTLVITALVKVV